MLDSFSKASMSFIRRSVPGVGVYLVFFSGVSPRSNSDESSRGRLLRPFALIIAVVRANTQIIRDVKSIVVSMFSSSRF